MSVTEVKAQIPNKNLEEGGANVKADVNIVQNYVPPAPETEQATPNNPTDGDEYDKKGKSKLSD